jgi:hypothetical protein
LFKDFRLRLVELRTQASESLGAFFQASGEFCEPGFLLTYTPLTIFNVTHYGVTFLFAALLLQPQV